MEYEYFEIRVSCIKSEIDKIELLLMSIGACSVTYRDAKDTAILEPLPGQTPLWQDIHMTAMFVKDYDEQQILTTIQKQLPAHKIVCERLQSQVWIRTWLEHFEPMLFGTNTWIIPSEFAAVDTQAINIYLDPGLAFGTGTHATTALCLQWVDANNLQGMNVIDFGCGSGILAIAALKHGANKVYCTDIDPQAIESTLANAVKNHVHTGIIVIAADQVTTLENLDIVMANILAAPLMSLVDTFRHMLKTGGQLLMSGILVEQTDDIVAKFSPSFVDFQIKIVEDWACVYARKQ